MQNNPNHNADNNHASDNASVGNARAVDAYAGAQQAAQRRRSALNQVALYFPVLLMLALAAGTLWLMKHAPNTKEDVQTQRSEYEQEIDYFMQDYGLRTFGADGKLGKSLRGDRLEVRTADQSQQTEKVFFKAQNKDGTWVVASAQAGVRSADGLLTTLKGNVRIKHQNADRSVVMTDVRSALVELDEEKQRITLRDGVRLVKGKQTLRSQSGQLLLDKKILKLHGGVKATITR